MPGLLHFAAGPERWVSRPRAKQPLARRLVWQRLDEVEYFCVRLIQIKRIGRAFDIRCKCNELGATP